MTSKTFAFAAALLTITRLAAAQTPPKPVDATRSDPSRSVTLSLTEYNRLLDLANRPPRPVAPMPALVASADLRVRVDGEVARGVFNLAGDVLQAGVTRVNLMAGGATVTDATADGKPLPLLTDGATASALLPGPGPFAVTLEWGTPLTLAPGRAAFAIPVPPAGAARATIDLPGEQADVHVSTGLITRRTASGGRTVVEVALRPGTQAEVWWSMRDSAPVAAAREVRLLADVLTLVTIGDLDVRMTALVDVTVAQGEPRTIDVSFPGGYELSGVSGSSIASSEPREHGVVLTVSDPALRRHQFLVSLERTQGSGSFTMDTDVVALPGVQRERGEIAIEGVGTLELSAAERPGMHRIDVRELNGALQSLARLPILSAYRYQRNAGSQIALAMSVRRFPDAAVLAAAADRASATTLVTTEGRALTEIVLQVRNRAQPFLKVTLPSGATIVSVEVAGEGAKPVVGADGTRVPLLRSGFRPTGLYRVSYVYVHGGAPLARKGELAMTLPKMDMPIGVLEWELFVPAGYDVQPIDGNVIERSRMVNVRRAQNVGGGSGTGRGSGIGPGSGGGTGGGVYRPGTATSQIIGGLEGAVADGIRVSIVPGGVPGQIGGRVTDSAGGVLPGVTIDLVGGSTHKSAVTGADGMFLATGLPSGAITVSAQLAGFTTRRHTFEFDQQARRIDFVLSVGSLTETVTVAAGKAPPPAAPELVAKVSPPSPNVIDLQRRAAGVLPIHIDVPRAGTSHEFVKPLLVDQEATLSLRYKRR